MDKIRCKWSWPFGFFFHMRILDSVFANMRMGILPNLKKTNMCIFHVSLYFFTKNTLFLPQKWYFCIGNGIYDPKLTHFGQLSAAQDNQPTHIWVFQFVSAAGALVVIITV